MTSLLVAGAAPAAAGPLSATSFIRGKPAPGRYAIWQTNAVVGDLNRDGKADMAFANGKEISIVYGSAPTPDADLAADLGSRGFRIDTGAYGEVLSVATAGDFDRDGYGDLIASTESAAFVFYGGPTDRGTLTATAGGRFTQFTGKVAANVADSADGIGDFNGDGYADVALQRGDVGSAIVTGGPRAASISATSATGRVSLINAIQRCGFVWFTFACVDLGVDVQALGDVDGDGKSDVAIESSNPDGNFVLYGRSGSFTTKPEPGSGKTRLPTPPTTHDGSWRIGQLHAAGDVNGDGLADVIAYGTSIYLGRRGQPSSISASDPTIKLKTATNLLDAIPVGDQDGDGAGDLLVREWATAGGPAVRLVTGLPRSLPATVDVDAAPRVPGVPLNVGPIEDAGDVDGDGQVDGLVSTSGDGESAYVLTHSTGTPGPTTRPAKLQATLRVYDAVGQPVNGALSVRGTCAGAAFGPTSVIWGSASTVNLAANEGDACSVTPQVQYSAREAAKLAKCSWRDTATLNTSQSIDPAGSFKLSAGVNDWLLERRCVLPTGEYPQGFGESTGWIASGASYLVDDIPDSIVVTGPQESQTGSLMWAFPLDFRNRTIEFKSYLAGGNGPAEGIAVGFVRPDATGQPAGGRLGIGGNRLGFGGLKGTAVAFDVKRDAPDPSANFIGFTDGGLENGGLRWYDTADAVTPLYGSTVRSIKIANKAGTTTVSIDGVVRMRSTLAVPSSAFLTFTGSTGPVKYQLQQLTQLKISATP